MKINRKEKQYRGSECLNCEHPLDISDKYCSNCGQLNSTKKLTLKDFIEEFFGNFYAYDSRLRNSIISIFTKPGQLAKEFINGKRQHYANPFRLFLSVAIIMAIVEGSDFEKGIKVGMEEEKKDREKNEQTKLNTKTFIKNDDIELHQDSIYTHNQLKDEEYYTENKINTFYNYYQKHKEEDSEKCFKKLGYENTFINRLMYSKVKKFETKNFTSEIFKSILNNLPIILFISLPILTLMFWLVSFRRFTYTDNLVFTYTFYTFLLLLFFFNSLLNIIDTTDKGYVSMSFTFLMFFIVLPIYFYKSLKNFYGWSRWKTILKFILLNILFVPFLIFIFLYMLFFGTIIF